MPNIISRETLIPISVALAVAVPVFAGAFTGYVWLDSQFDSVRQEFTSMATEVAAVKTDVSATREDVGVMGEVLRDRLTRGEFIAWTQLFFATNKDLVPVAFQ